MSVNQTQLSGWQGVVAAIVVLGVIGLRLMTFDNNVNDSELTRKLEFEIMTNYFSGDVENLRAIYESGDQEATTAAVKSVTTSKVNIESVQTSSPLFSFSTNQEVVVKVAYSLDDASGKRDSGMNYYLFRHGSFGGDTWRFQHETGPISYYLNFM